MPPPSPTSYFGDRHLWEQSCFGCTGKPSTCHVSYIIYHFSCIVHHFYFILRNSLSITHQSSVISHQSSSIIHRHHAPFMMKSPSNPNNSACCLDKGLLAHELSESQQILYPTIVTSADFGASSTRRWSNQNLSAPTSPSVNLLWSHLSDNFAVQVLG